MFKRGDTVKYVRKPVNTICSDYAILNGLKKGKTYTVTRQHTTEAYIKVKPVENANYWVHNTQFAHAKMTNEERMEERKKQLCARQI